LVRRGYPLAVAAISIVAWLDIFGTPYASLLTSAFPVLVAATLIAVRREAINGLEFAIYWFGVALILYWGFLPIAAQSAVVTAAWSYFNDVFGYRTAGIVLAGLVILSALLLLLARAVLRWSRLSHAHHLGRGHRRDHGALEGDHRALRQPGDHAVLLSRQ
jgi:hypothetical protein